MAGATAKTELVEADKFAPLTAPEKSRFRKLDKAVREGIGTFVAVGTALKEIRDGLLYREEFLTFEAYVDERHELSRSRGYQLIDAAETVKQIEMSTNCGQFPSNIPDVDLEPMSRLVDWLDAKREAASWR